MENISLINSFDWLQLLPQFHPILIQTVIIVLPCQHWLRSEDHRNFDEFFFFGPLYPGLYGLNLAKDEMVAL